MQKITEIDQITLEHIIWLHDLIPDDKIISSEQLARVTSYVMLAKPRKALLVWFTECGMVSKIETTRQRMRRAETTVSYTRLKSPMGEMPAEALNATLARILNREPESPPTPTHAKLQPRDNLNEWLS